ncbi:hypothetical protein [Mesorhizobium sp. ANAO-SY3R2]|uniref:hypothetical protein n=1 Tax=Mesorhizobium sp. ANAO-SY3R2 TaxID=3166644 RepID=UPI00366AD860
MIHMHVHEHDFGDRQRVIVGTIEAMMEVSAVAIANSRNPEGRRQLVPKRQPAGRGLSCSAAKSPLVNAGRLVSRTGLSMRNGSGDAGAQRLSFHFVTSRSISFLSQTFAAR